MKRKRSLFSRKLPSGFTLIEVLVTVGIIAVLATPVVTVLKSSAYVYVDLQALRHQKKDNVLFCDGHVEALPKDTFGRGIMVRP